MSVDLESAARLNALKQGIEAKTGETYPDLTGGVNALIAGFGQGGGGSDGDALAWSILDRTVESITAGAELTKMGYRALFNATKLHTVNAPYVTHIDIECFAGCSQLKNVNFGVIGAIAARVFQNCTALERFVIKTTKQLAITSGSPAIFQGCTSLKYVDLDLCISIHVNTFNNCANLSVVALRRFEGVVALGNISAFSNTPFAVGGTGGTVYVPAALIESYKTATNWVTLYEAGTCNFVAIEGSEYE